MIQIEYDTHNPMMNLGTVAFWMFVLFCKLIFVFLVLLPLSKVSDAIKPYYLKFKNELFFSDFLQILLEANIEFLLMFTLYDLTPKQNLDFNYINDVISYVFFYIVTILLPICIIYVIL